MPVHSSQRARLALRYLSIAVCLDWAKLADLLHDAKRLLGRERAQGAAPPITGHAVFDRAAECDLVIRRFSDRDRVELAEGEVHVDELAARSLQTLFRRGHALVPVLDRLDALVGEVNERDVARHAGSPPFS